MYHLKPIVLLLLLFTSLAISQEPSSKKTKATKALIPSATIEQLLAKKVNTKTEEQRSTKKRKATKAKPAAFAMQEQLRKKYIPSKKEPIKAKPVATVLDEKLNKKLNRKQ
jgi:hypothetical protein